MGLPAKSAQGRGRSPTSSPMRSRTPSTACPKAEAARSGGGRDRRRAGDPLHRQRGLGQEAGLPRARGRGLRGASRSMIGRLNHVAIAVQDLAAASRTYRETLGAEVSAPLAHRRARRHGRVRHPAEHQDRAARAARRGFARSPSSSSETRTAASTTSATRSTTSWPRAIGSGAPARGSSAPASRGSARTASPCCSCIRRTSSARWSNWSRPEPACTSSDPAAAASSADHDRVVVALSLPGGRRRRSACFGLTAGGAVALYFVVWWIGLFAVLPFGARSQAEDGSVDGRQRAGRAVARRRCARRRSGRRSSRASSCSLAAGCDAARRAVGRAASAGASAAEPGKRKSKALALLEMPFGNS